MAWSAGVGAHGAVYRVGVSPTALTASPLVVPGIRWLDGGEQEADQRLADRVEPGVVFARQRSRTAYSRLSRAGVLRLLRHTFPTALETADAQALSLPHNARVIDYPTANSTELMLSGHRPAIVESTAPLAERATAHRYVPIALGLSRSGGDFVPVRSPVAVQIPSQLSDGVRMPQNDVSLTPVDGNGRPLRGTGALVGGSVVYANTGPASDTLVKPTATGFRIDGLLRSFSSPQRLLFHVGPMSAKLVRETSGDVRVIEGGATIATILAPGATDAAGSRVPVSASVLGHTLVVEVRHRSDSFLYPIEVDPEINDAQLATTTGGKRSNWVFQSTSEARFGHNAVYEGPGKERLETNGIAEYGGSEFAYWTYETKGNSKIYELKAKTSAKNKGAKIESFLEFQSPGGRESKKTLSNEFEEPEYGEKTTTICAWNASKVEECLPGAGKEKDAVRFQQSATASPGSSFKFSDTMSEGVVSISEPAGEHSTTSFNTTSPEVEGEVVVEGKKVVQKRVNALYGSGSWLTNSRGALQMIAKDPGVGVSATHLEYEKFAGVWERLSEHNYLEVENACQGVQCYAEHAEYWTLDPKLPDGVDKIRYRAQEAIAGTESPAEEPSSTATIKIDTKAPHNVVLSGLPYGDELTEKPYKLTTEATDGEGSTVASSGIPGVLLGAKGEVISKGLALYVDGGEVSEVGKQVGCTAPQGECTAKAEWTINGAELGAGHHAIVLVTSDNAGNEKRVEYTISVRHSTPVPLGPGSVDLQSGDYTLVATDASMGSGLTVARNYSSRATAAGDEGPFGPEWALNLGTTESLSEMVDGSVLLTDANGRQTIFAALGAGRFESPTGDSNLELTLEENKVTNEKLAYYLKDTAKHTSVKFTQPASGTSWMPTTQEGTVPTDAVAYSYQVSEQHQEYPVPAGSRPTAITAGPNGNVWFVEHESEKIAEMNPDGGITEFSTHSAEGPKVELGEMTLGPDGNVWYTSQPEAAIDEMTPTGERRQIAKMGQQIKLGGITSGPDGKLWFVESSGNENKVGEVGTSGPVTEYALPAHSEPTDITVGPDRNMWFVDSNTSKVGRITTSGAITEYALPTGSHPEGITSGPDGRLWFTEPGTKKIGAITTSEPTISEYALATGYIGKEIIAGSDGNVWFIYYGPGTGRGIGRVTPTGIIKIYALPNESSPKGLALGLGGDIWYTNEYPGKVGMMPPGGVVVEPSEVRAAAPAGVSCSPEPKSGCRSLRFRYASTTTATGEARSEWGEYAGRLTKVMLSAYDPAGKEMKETAVAEYSYDQLGRLRAEWDPRVSPALKTSYGYDNEGHITALTPPGAQPWTFTYGSIAGDSGSGRLLKMYRTPASEPLWNGASLRPGTAPQVGGTPIVGVRMGVPTGSWEGSPVIYGYQWERCSEYGEYCEPIAGAHNPNYTPVAEDTGHTLRARVTATNAGGSQSVVSSTSRVVAGSSLSEYSLPAGSKPYGVTLGSENNIWFTTSNKVGKITPSGVITEYASGNEGPKGITFAGGDAWFVEGLTPNVASMTTAGSLTEYHLTRSSTENIGIASGPDGNLWFTEEGTGYIGKMTTTGEVVGEYALPSGSKPLGIMSSATFGSLFFAEYGTSKIGQITTSGAITEYSLPAGSKPYSVAQDLTANIWFTEYGSNKIGKIISSGVVEYSLPFGIGKPAMIVSDEGDGDMWFTENELSSIGKITPSGVITEYPLPAGSKPMGIVKGPKIGQSPQYLWVAEQGTDKIARFYPPSEEQQISPSPGYTIEYGTPLSGAAGRQAMTSKKVAAWGQGDVPVEATAILPPDAPQGWPASDYKRATIYYLDEHGRMVNVSSPSTAPYGSVSTTEYNESNDVVRTLSPDNRQAALESGTKSTEVAKSLSTFMSYRAKCSKESENNHEVESFEEGTRLCDVEGPQHTIRYVTGKEQHEALGRLHTKYFYDEEAPGGETHNLQTKTVTLAELSNEAKEEVEGRVTKTSYSGQSNLGWQLRAPTSVTVDPEGKKLTTTTLYNSVTGQISETRSPAGSGGGSPHDTRYVYYSAEANTEGFSSCGSHPEWAGLLCETLPAKQPETSGVPNLPVTVVSSYNMYDEPLVITETFGSTVRTKTKTYDVAGRLLASETTSSANTALPWLFDEYSPTTGVLERISTTVGGKIQSIVSKYNTLGQLTEYTDADGNIAKYRYAGPENDGLLEEVTDGSDGGTGKQSYSYNSTTKQLEELTDSAAGVFKASYDADGKIVSETYPNAMCADTSYNSVGEAVKLEYIKTSVCSEHSAPVWFSETRAPSVRGETFSRSSTLANETYGYDSVGRLTEAQETPSGEGCSVRLYGYDEESNRTSQTTRTPGTGGKCATEGGTVLEHSYDTGNRLTDAGISYDSFGDITKLPAGDAEGHELSSSYYVDGAVASQTQNSVTNAYLLDPEGRTRETTSGASAVVSHYDGAGQAVAWTSEAGGKSTRNIPGIDGSLAATQENGGTPVLQLQDLQGDITATAALSPSETKLLSTYNSTEFGVPSKEKAPPKFAWVGAGDIASSLSSGVITYGATSYVPQIGRALQSETVEAPGIAPHGTGAGAAYVSQVEPWVFQGAAAEATEAPGLEAAREQTAREEAERAAAWVDPTEVHYMNKTKAIKLAYELWNVKAAGEFAASAGLDGVIPGNLIKAASEFLSGLGISTVFSWFQEAAGKLSKCGKSHWKKGSVKADICKFEYDVFEIPIIGTRFVNFFSSPKVWVCYNESGNTCFREVSAEYPPVAEA